ncbi:hypothetical protein JL720_11637 [Aureococcus anophagefferens]|nr:hypothetical protein JL720_11637 [Aureococcus anophagefferens]
MDTLRSGTNIARAAVVFTKAHPQIGAIALGIALLVALRLRRLFGFGRQRSKEKEKANKSWFMSHKFVGLMLVAMPALLLLLHVAVGRALRRTSTRYSSKIPPPVLRLLPRHVIYLVDHPSLAVSLGMVVAGLLIIFLVTWARFVYRILRSTLVAYVLASSGYGAWAGYRSAPGSTTHYRLALALAGARRPVAQLLRYLASPITSFVAHTRLVLAPLLRALAIQSRVIGVLLAQGYWVLGLTKHFASRRSSSSACSRSRSSRSATKLELAAARRELRERLGS